MGAVAASAAGRTWGCTPGALANQAISTFAANVNSTKNSVNKQIAQVKANKQYQYQQYQAYLAWLAEQARRAQLAAMAAAQPLPGETEQQYTQRMVSQYGGSSQIYREVYIGSKNGHSFGDTLSMIITGIGFSPAFANEAAKLAEKFGGVAVGGTIVFRGLVGLSIINVGVDVYSTWASGGSGKDILYSALWSGGVATIGFIPYVGPLLALGIAAGDYATNGQWRQWTYDRFDDIGAAYSSGLRSPQGRYPMFHG